MNLGITVLALWTLAFTATASSSPPYPVTVVSANAEQYSAESNILHITAIIENGFSSHSDDWTLSFNGIEYRPEPSADSELSGSTTLDFIIPSYNNSSSISLTCSACSDTACLLPRTFTITPDLRPPAVTKHTSNTGYTFSSADGYMNAAEFTAFIKGRTNFSPYQNDKNIIILFFTFLLAGISLNLTPCVLPMIPVQLSILGIGAKRTTKSNGFKRGLSYGLGMAVTYGVLGLVIALTGGIFGTIQSSPWFNFSVGAVFSLLALSLLDIFPIDFSHFGHYAGSLASTSAVFFLGAATALLAGSCVAPAVIAAILLSGTMYASGSPLALALPLALGIGMGLPWPFIGAGIASLPKPGKWMRLVKAAMALAVIAVACIYFLRAYNAFRGKAVKSDSINAADGIESVSRQIDMALSHGKPVLLDFKASWCNSCAAMENTVFTDSEVSSALNGLTILKIQAEDPSDPAVKSVLSAFNVHGLPAFRIIQLREHEQ